MPNLEWSHKNTKSGCLTSITLLALSILEYEMTGKVEVEYKEATLDGNVGKHSSLPAKLKDTEI